MPLAGSSAAERQLLLSRTQKVTCKYIEQSRNSKSEAQVPGVTGKQSAPKTPPNLALTKLGLILCYAIQALLLVVINLVQPAGMCCHLHCSPDQNCSAEHTQTLLI